MRTNLIIHIQFFLKKMTMTDRKKQEIRFDLIPTIEIIEDDEVN